MCVFFDDQIFHLQRYGGISRYVCGLASALATNHAMPVVLFGAYTANEPLERTQPVAGLTIIHRLRRDRLRINKSVKWASRQWRRIAFLSAKRRHGAVIYHPSALEPDPFIHRRAAGTVVTVHDFIDEIVGDRSRHTLNAIERKRRAVSLADRIVCSSESTYNDLKKFHPEAAGRASIAYLASDIAPAPVAAEKGAAPFLLVVGNRDGYKNGRLALAAFSQIATQFPDIRLRVCGPKLSQEEISLLGKNLAETRVDRPAMDDSTLALSYQNAVALIYPSLYEGFGLPVHEAMKLGCPVITTRASSLPEVGGDAALYLEKDAGPSELITHLTTLLTNGSERNRLKEAGLVQAAKFSVALNAADMFAVYSDMLSRPRG